MWVGKPFLIFENKKFSSILNSQSKAEVPEQIFGHVMS